ncbi:MAG: hypothetical protein ABI678_07230 [Kofleriaceae bacterium]
MDSPDPQFRIGVFAGGLVLVGVITYLRFCGHMSLPGKPPPPTGPTGTQRQLLSQTTATPGMYLDFLERDAASAGVRTPTVEDMSRKLAYRVDEARHVLSLGQPSLEVAGLRLRVERSGDTIVLVIQNLLTMDLAYHVATEPSIGTGLCNSARPLPINAMVIAKGATETRTECVFRDGISIVVTTVETVELGALSSYYLSEVPPVLVGIDDRIARGHHGVDTKEPCSAVSSSVVRSGLERGDLGWRDLVDFYARHRCQTYQFPPTYRAFRSDGERQVPITN